MFQCTSAEVAKLLACKKSLWLAHQWCDGRVILESNCSNCVSVFAEHGINRSIYAGLVEDSKYYKNDEKCSFVQDNIELNIVAHELTQYARRAFCSKDWLAEIPSCIGHIVLLDCNET